MVSHHNARFFISVLNKSNNVEFLYSLVVHSKFGKLCNLWYQYHIFSFKIYQKSYSIASKVIDKEPICTDFFHRGNQKAEKIFVELNYHFLNSFCINCCIIIWCKLFKNGPSKICGRQPLKNYIIINIKNINCIN